MNDQYNETRVKVLEVKTGEELRIPCVHCNANTYHNVLTHVRSTDSDYHLIRYEYEEEASATHNFYTVQCCGCRRVSVYLRQELSQDPFWVGEKRFPVEDEPSRFLGEMERIVPDTVRRIYDEATQALDNKMPVLAGVGIRALVETVCIECKTESRNLFGRINEMVDLGFITADGAKILHGLRMLGNKAAHEVKPHKLSELNAAFDVIDHLLQGVYLIPAKAKELPENEK